MLASLPFPVELSWNDNEVFGHFDGWWLTTEFHPVADAGAPDTPPRVAARLKVHGQFGQTLSANWLFAMNFNEHKAISLLKLIRVLHLINHLGRNGPDGGLRIDVDPRLCRSLSTHLIDFTAELLGRLDLAPPLVQFLLYSDDETRDVEPELVARYRAGGHQVGLGQFGNHPDDLLRVWRLEPDFITLSPRHLHRATTYPHWRKPLLQLLPALVEQGYALGVEEISCGKVLELAQSMQARYLSGPWITRLLQETPPAPTASARQPAILTQAQA